MIKFINIINSEPYNLFEKFYKQALDHNEKFIEAISVSSYDKTSNQVDSRYVNLKYIINICRNKIDKKISKKEINIFPF